MSAETKHIEEGLRQQALNRAQRVRKQASDTDVLLRNDTGSCTSNDNTPRKKLKHFSDDSSTENSLLDGLPESSQPDIVPQLNEIELVFKPYPEDGAERNDEARYIKTTANATVDHLSKYLAIRLSLEVQNDTDPSSADESKYAIFISTGADKYTPLPGNMTLEQVNDKFWKVNKPLEMFYARQKKSAESPAKKGVEK